MKVLDKKTLLKFLKLAGETLQGDWVLIGGTVLPLLGSEHRTTTDIDLVGIEPGQQTQTLLLMELAESLGLPVETINQAGGYFLRKIPQFNKNIIILHEGKTARIFRPNLFLFIQLKTGRLSASDLSDCLEFITTTRRRNEPFEKPALIALVKAELKKKNHALRKERLNKLLKTLELE